MVSSLHRSGWLLLQHTASRSSSSHASRTAAGQFLSVSSSRELLLTRCLSNQLLAAGCTSAGSNNQNSSSNPPQYRRRVSYITQPLRVSQQRNTHCSTSSSSRINNRKNKSSPSAGSSSESYVGIIQTIGGYRRTPPSHIPSLVETYVNHGCCYSSFIGLLRCDPAVAAVHCNACLSFTSSGVPASEAGGPSSTRISPAQVAASQVAATPQKTASTGRPATPTGAANFSLVTANAEASIPGAAKEGVHASPTTQVAAQIIDRLIPGTIAAARRDATAEVPSLSEGSAKRKSQLMRIIWRSPLRENPRRHQQQQTEEPQDNMHCCGESDSSSRQHQHAAMSCMHSSAQQRCSNWQVPAPLKPWMQEWEQKEQRRMQEQQQQRRAVLLFAWSKGECQEAGYRRLEQQHEEQQYHSRLLQHPQEQQLQQRVGRRKQQHEQQSQRHHQQQALLRGRLCYQERMLHAQKSPAFLFSSSRDMASIICKEKNFLISPTVSAAACGEGDDELKAVETAPFGSQTTPLAIQLPSARAAAAPAASAPPAARASAGAVALRPEGAAAVGAAVVTAGAGSRATTVATSAAGRVVGLGGPEAIAKAAEVSLRLSTAALEAAEPLACALGVKHSVVDGEAAEAAAERWGHAAAVAYRRWEGERNHPRASLSTKSHNFCGVEASARYRRRWSAAAAVRGSRHTSLFSPGSWSRAFGVLFCFNSLCPPPGVSQAAAATPALAAALTAGSTAAYSGTAAGTTATPTALVTASAAVKLPPAVAAAATAARFTPAAVRGALAALSRTGSLIRPAATCLPEAAGAFHSSATAAAAVAPPPAAQLLQRRWWTRASGMRKPVKWTRDWEVLNRKVYYAFDEKDIRRSLLDTISSQRSCCSVFYSIIDMLPPLIHTLSLPGPFTVFVPTNEAFETQARSPLPWFAELRRSIDLLLLRQRQSLQQQTHFRSVAEAGVRLTPEGGVGIVESNKEIETGTLTVAGGELASSAAYAKAAEHLRLFVLAHVIPGEFRLKALLTEGGGGSKTIPCIKPAPSVDALRLFAPMTLPTTSAGNSLPRLKTHKKREEASVFRSTEKRNSKGRAVDEFTSQGEHYAARAAFVSSSLSDNDDVGFWLPPSLAGEHPLLVKRSPSIFAQFMSLAASNNLPQVQSHGSPHYLSGRRDEVTGRHNDKHRTKDKNQHAEGGESRVSASTAITKEPRYEGKRRYLRGLTHINVGDSLIVKSDLRAHNGVVHLIDRPIFPHILKIASGS